MLINVGITQIAKHKVNIFFRNRVVQVQEFC